ncbi:hypothetical protein [Akkermansia biwaensis]
MNIVAPSTEQTGNASKHAEFVFNKYGDGMTSHKFNFLKVIYYMRFYLAVKPVPGNAAKCGGRASVPMETAAAEFKVPSARWHCFS